jgi:hypothetical protein
MMLQLDGCVITGGTLTVYFETPEEEANHVAFVDTHFAGDATFNVERAWEDETSDEFEIRVRKLLKSEKPSDKEWISTMQGLIDMLCDGDRSTVSFTMGALLWLANLAQAGSPRMGFSTVLKEFGMDPDDDTFFEPDDEPDHD